MRVMNLAQGNNQTHWCDSNSSLTEAFSF